VRQITADVHLGHKPPRPPQAGVTGLPPIAAARTHGCGGGSGPEAVSCTAAKFALLDHLVGGGE
jgi:hypothetical protein